MVYAAASFGSNAGKICSKTRTKLVKRYVVPYRVTGLPVAPFRPFFALGEDELNARGMRRLTAGEKPGFPCRVTLQEAEPGETLILLSYEHHRADLPYRAQGPIFVRENATQPFDRVNEIPPVLRGRFLSLRAYDRGGMMSDADVIEGTKVEDLIMRLLADDATQTIHVHYARQGCYACKVERT